MDKVILEMGNNVVKITCNILTDNFLLISVFCIIVFIVAFVIDRRSWKNKKDEDFIAMTLESNAMKVGLGIKMLHKRGKDISEYVSRLVPFLVSQSKLQRISTERMIKEFYPDDHKLIEGYDGKEQGEQCLIKAKPLFEKYGIEHPTQNQ